MENVPIFLHKQISFMHLATRTMYYFLCASHIFSPGCSVDVCSLNGSSSTSETFNNPCLSQTDQFKIKDVEVHILELVVLHMLHFSYFVMMKPDSNNLSDAALGLCQCIQV
jgi:hypothetical protein